MFFGPIVSLEMVTGARRARYFIIRIVYAAVLLGLLWINYVDSPLQRRSTPQATVSIRAVADFSRTFFITFSFAQLVAVLFLTPAMIAGSIAQERERRTIEYLFASTLSGSEIIFSKFLGRTLHVTVTLLVGLPILAIVLMLGGVEPMLLFMVFLVTVATLVALSALSIATSVWSKRSRDAVIRTYLYLLVFLALPPLAWILSNPPFIWPWVSKALEGIGAVTLVNPFYVIGSLLMFTSNSGQTYRAIVGPVLVVYPLFTLLSLAWATLSVRRVYRKSMGVSEGKRVRGTFPRWRPRLGKWPMLWKELFAGSAALHLGMLGRVAVLLLFAGATAPAFLIFWDEITTRQIRNGIPNQLVGTSIAIVTLLECAALLVVATRAAGSITSEKERDSWLTLVSTTLTPSEIIWAKTAGSMYAARWFALPIGIWWLLVVILTPRYLGALPILLAPFFCIAWALAALGVWFSSWCTTSIRAMGGTVALGVFLGGGYLLCCMPFYMVGRGHEALLGLSACIPFLLACPSMLWLAFVDRNDFGPEAMNMVLAFFIGVGGYLVLGFALMQANIRNFDVRVGRPIEAWTLPPAISSMGPPPPPPQGSGNDGASAV
jgi:ABC-type transport system involved in multi-copper enzyme maturation permease subunit